MYTLDDVAAIVAALKPIDPLAHAAFAVAAFGGLRLSEIQALTWRDIHLAERTLEVRRTRWRSHVSDPKSRASRNWIAIVERLADILRKYRAAPPVDPRKTGWRAVTTYEEGALFTLSLDQVGRRVIWPALSRDRMARVARGSTRTSNYAVRAWFRRSDGEPYASP